MFQEGCSNLDEVTVDPQVTVISRDNNRLFRFASRLYYSANLANDLLCS